MKTLHYFSPLPSKYHIFSKKKAFFYLLQVWKGEASVLVTGTPASPIRALVLFRFFSNYIFPVFLCDAREFSQPLSHGLVTSWLDQGEA